MKPSHARFLIPFIMLFPLLMGSKCKKTPPPDPVGTTPDDATPPEVELQVVSIDPASGVSNEPFNARVYGSSFSDGARVLFGTNEGAQVNVLDSNTIKLIVPALTTGVYDVVVTNPSGQRAVLRRGLTIGGASSSACSHVTVQFDFDSSELNSEAIRALSAQASCMGGSRGTIRVEGHCDERGTSEYNIALGQRRASVVQKYLTSQGISPSRLETISYGEERPLAQGSGESTWARNRRAEIYLGN